MRAFSAVVVFCAVVLSALVGNIFASECPPCIDAQSNACRRWGSGQAKFQWASSEDVSSSITLTSGPCGQGGESGTGYIMMDCDVHSATCDYESPCDDGMSNMGAFAIIKVGGNKKAYHQIFPGGISFVGDKLTSNGKGYRGIAAGLAGCEYQLPLASAGHSRIKVGAAVAGCDSEYDGSKFNIEVKFFQEVGNAEVEDRYTLLATATGSITVKRNDKTSFDAANFVPDLRDGSSMSNMKEIARTYDEEGGDSQWKIDYRGMDYECEQKEGWCGPWGAATTDLVPDDETFYRVKYPGWKDSANGQPPYAEDSGWDYDDSNNRLSYDMGDLGTIYYHCENASNGSVRAHTVERCSEQQQAGSGTVQWTFFYDSLDRIKYIHNASYDDPNNPADPNSLDDATIAYEYTYVGDGNDPTVVYKTRPDTQSTWTDERQWTLEFNDDGEATKYIGGCSSCSGSGSFEHIEYHSDYPDEVLWQKNAAGEIILQNDYQIIEYGDYEDAGWMYIPDGDFEYQDVAAGNCATFINQSFGPYGWNSANTTITAQICDPNSGSGQYLMLDDEQSPDTIYQDLYAVMANTIYDLDVYIRAHAFETGSYATITLNAVQGVNVEQLGIIDVNDFDLTDGSWEPFNIQWNSTPHSDPEDTENCLIDLDNPWTIQIVITGDKVDIDGVNLSTSIWVGGQTKALLSEQQRRDPSSGNLVTVLERNYDQAGLKMIERRYTASNVCRVIRYDYEGKSLTNIVQKTEYENTGTSTSMPTGDSYITTYESDDPNEIYITYYPNGKRADYQRYEYGNLIESYVIDCVTDANSMREEYNYTDVDNVDPYSRTYQPNWRLESHTNTRGGITEYDYIKQNGSWVLETQTDPNTAAGKQEVTYTYDDARRVIQEVRKLDSERNLKTSYEYNPTTGYLDSVTVNGATTYYRYNSFGQVIRETNPDGVMTGKSYGTGGELVSDFVIEENSDPNLADASLTLITQTRYTYTDDGKIEFLGQYKSDTSFSYQSDMTTNASNWIVTKYEYYPNGQKKKTIEDCGAGRKNLTTEYFYNYLGEIVKVLYPTGKWVKTYRDGRGLVTSEETGYGTDNVVLESAYGYDDNGNLYWQSNPDGSFLVYTYDNYDRLKRTYTGGLNGPYKENFYNEAGDVVRAISCEADGTIQSDRRMGYDDQGNLVYDRLCAEPDTLSNSDDLITFYKYNLAGNLCYEIKAGLTNTDPNQSRIDPNDIVVEYRYNNRGLKTQTVDPEGYVHSVFYTNAGLPQIIVDPNDPQDPNAFITENFYDAYGRLEKTIDPMFHYTKYWYNSLNQVTKLIVYDCNDTLVSEDDFAVRQYRTVYDNLGNITRRTMMADAESTSDITLGVDFVADYVFEPNGLPKEQKSYVGTGATVAITSFSYDSIGRRIQRTDPEGNKEKIYYNSDKYLGSQVTKVEKFETDSDGSDDYTVRTFMLYDDEGRLSARILDKDGDNSIDTTDPNTSYTYDGLGRVKTEAAPDDVVTHYEFDGFGNIEIKIEDYVDGTPDIDHDRKTEFAYNRLNQQYQMKVYDPNETTSHIAVQTTTYEYNKNGNVTKITYPDEGYVTYEYNLLNKLDMETKRDGTVIYYGYYWSGDLWFESDDPAGPDGTPDFLAEFKYNAASDLTYAYKTIDGSEVSESSFTYNGFGLKTSETTQYNDEFSKVTNWSYDGSGHLHTQTHGTTTLTYTHDKLGRIKTIDKGNDEIVSYDYIGRNTESIDYPEAETTQLFAYDELGRIEQRKGIDNSLETILDFQYTYDNVGNRDTCKYNHLTTPVYDVYEYDSLRRLEAVTYADPDGIVALATDTLTLGDLALFASAWMNDESVNFTDYADFREYKNEMLLSQRLELMENVLKEAGYRNIDSFLNSVKGIKQIAYNPNEPIYTFAIFAEDVPNNYTTESVTNDDGDVIAQIIWDNKGRMVLFAMYPESGDTVVVSKSYDSKGSLTADTITTFDSDGDVTYTEDMLASESETVTAITLSTSSMMVTSSVVMSSTAESMQPKTDEFGYDHLGNRTTVSYNSTSIAPQTLEYTHNPVNQYSTITESVLTSSTTRSLDHDDNGNLSVDENGYGYSYDYRNRLIEAQDPNSNTIAEYTFDALGRRISKTVGSETIYFFYDPQGRVLAEYKDGDLDREYVWGNGINEILAMFTPYHAGDPNDWDDFVDFCGTWLLSSGDTGYDDSFDYVNDNTIDFEDFAHWASVWDIPSGKESDWYYLTDALGSVRGLIGGRFNRESDREFYNYDVYGNPSIEDDEESLSGNTYLFAGSRYDDEAGLYHKSFRNYCPATGRWLQFDPIGTYDSMNLYEYVKSNPTTRIDILGLSSGYDGSFTGDWELDRMLSQPFMELWQKLFGGSFDEETTEWTPDTPHRYQGTTDGFLDTLIEKIKQKSQKDAGYGQEFILATIPPWGVIKAGFELTASRKKCCHCEGPKKNQIGEMIEGSVELFAKIEAGATVKFVKHSRGELQDIFGGRYKPQDVLNNNQFVGGMNKGMTSMGAGFSTTPFSKLPTCETKLDGEVGLMGYARAGLYVSGFAEFPVGKCTFSGGCSWDFTDPRFGVEFDGTVGANLGLKVYGAGSGTIVVE